MPGQILKIFLRNLLKYRFISAINFLGLAMGMVAFLLILHYVRYEHSFDRFHSKSDRTFRVIMTRTVDGELVSKGPDTYPAMSHVLTDHFPGIEALDKILYSSRGGGLITFDTQDGKRLRDDVKSVSASSSFFDLFDIEISQGRSDLLDEPFKLMVSDALVEEVYGGKNPVGELIQEDDGRNYEIIGVYKKWQQNSHLEFDMIRSFESIGARHNSDLHQTSWDWPRMKTYITLEEGVDAKSFEEQIRNIISEYKSSANGLNLSETISLQPIQDIRLKSDFMSNGLFDQENVKVSVFMGLGVIILIMAWMNYTNLSMAHGLDRIKESGIRKVLGATKRFILRQHLIEALSINLLAGIMALSIYQLVLPYLNEFTGIPNSFKDGLEFYALVAAGLLIGSFISGLYPAIVLSRINVVLALKKKVNNLGTGVVALRNVLTSAQFAVSLSLLIVILAVYQQLNHLKSLDPGTKIEGVLVVKEPRRFDYDLFSSQPDVIKNEWKNVAGVGQVASSYAVPGGNISAYPTREVGRPVSANVNIHSHEVDHSFIELYELEFVAGRSFSREIATDENAAILNESAVRALGFDSIEEALGKRITTPMEGYIRHVIGVVKDYNQLSAHSPKQPIYFSLDPESRGYYSIEFSTENLTAFVEQIKGKFDSVFPNNIFHSFFLEDYYNEQFKREEQLSSQLTFFTTVAITLAIMGLVSITFFSVLRRIKEMSIRKVLGAQLRNLLNLYSREGQFNFLIASVISIPLSYILISRWLESFNSRISLNIQLFSIPIFVLFAITLIVILLVVLKAARSNPINALREE